MCLGPYYTNGLKPNKQEEVKTMTEYEEEYEEEEDTEEEDEED